MENCAHGFTQVFQLRCEDFLLASEIQIDPEKKLVPCSLPPTQLLIIRPQCRGRIDSGVCSTGKVKIRAPIVISRCPLQRMTDGCTNRKEPNRRRRALKRATQSQMHVNAREHQ